MIMGCVEVVESFVGSDDPNAIEVYFILWSCFIEFIGFSLVRDQLHLEC